MDRYCRICRNTSCSNHGKNITFIGEGWQCNYIPVPTNADRIRAMSDEELAEVLGKLVHCGGCPMRGNCKVDDLPCDNVMLEWLQQPAE